MGESTTYVPLRKSYPIPTLLPVNPNTPYRIWLAAIPTFKNDILFHVGADTQTWRHTK